MPHPDLTERAPDKDASPMRIAMITDGATVGQDSADLATALTRLGHDVVVHDNTHGGHRRKTDAITWLADQWRITRPAVVHNRSRSLGVAAVTAARGLAIPVVHSARGAEDTPTGTVERDIALRSDRVIVSHPAELLELVAGKVPRSRCSVVPYGVDTEHFTPDGDHPPIGLRHRLVAVGDLTPSTGFATAVAALAGVPDTELVIVGSPPHGAHAKDLRRYASRLGVADRLLICRSVTRSELPPLLRSAHIVLATPWRPRFGITALQAAACGVTVVANDIGGLADTVIDGITGLLVAPRRPRALAEAVRRLLAHPVLLQQYGATARDRAASRYSWNQIAVDTLNTYRHAGATARDGADVISLRRTHRRSVPAMQPDH
ncbi:MAG: glycosyltransferase [Actinophytocola sp.]|uniref:glycosyltransferase n=1 Tax=Actinophytocola sp. TaxID=1872138 RepID=UPI003C72DDA9